MPQAFELVWKGPSCEALLFASVIYLQVGWLSFLMQLSNGKWDVHFI